MRGKAKRDKDRGFRKLGPQRREAEGPQGDGESTGTGVGGRERTLRVPAEWRDELGMAAGNTNAGERQASAVQEDQSPAGGRVARGCRQSYVVVKCHFPTGTWTPGA